MTDPPDSVQPVFDSAAACACHHCNSSRGDFDGSQASQVAVGSFLIVMRPSGCDLQLGVSQSRIGEHPHAAMLYIQGEGRLGGLPNPDFYR